MAKFLENYLFSFGLIYFEILIFPGNITEKISIVLKQPEIYPGSL